MANLNATNLKTAVAKLIAKAAADEMRMPSADTYLSIIKNTPLMVPDYLGLRTSPNRTLEFALKSRVKRTVGSAISANHSGTRGDSLVIQPSWFTAKVDFVDSLKQYNNNEFSRIEGLAGDYENAYLDILEDLEDKAQSFLFDERTGVNGSLGGGGSFSTSDDVYNFPSTSVDVLLQKTKTVLEEMGYNVILLLMIYLNFKSSKVLEMLLT